VDKIFIPDASIGVTPQIGKVVFPDANIGVAPQVDKIVVPDANIEIIPQVSKIFIPDANIGVIPQVDKISIPDASMNVTSDIKKIFIPDATMRVIPDVAEIRVSDASMVVTPNLEDIILPDIPVRVIPQVDKIEYDEQGWVKFLRSRSTSDVVIIPTIDTKLWEEKIKSISQVEKVIVPIRPYMEKDIPKIHVATDVDSIILSDATMKVSPDVEDIVLPDSNINVTPSVKEIVFSDAVIGISFIIPDIEIPPITPVEVPLELSKSMKSIRAQFGEAIDKAAKDFSLDPLVLTALVSAESTGKNEALSPTGALGITQIQPATGRELGLKIPDVLVTLDNQREDAKYNSLEWQAIVKSLNNLTTSLLESKELTPVTDERLDPNKAIYASAKYLSSLIDKFGGNLQKGLAAYNSGAANVTDSINEAIKNGDNWTDNIRTDVLSYANKVIDTSQTRVVPQTQIEPQFITPPISDKDWDALQRDIVGQEPVVFDNSTVIPPIEQTTKEIVGMKRALISSLNMLGQTLVSALFNTKGGQMGSMMGGMLGSAALEELTKKTVGDVTTSTLGAFAGPLGLIGGSLIGGLIGSLFGGDEKPKEELVPALEDLTMATVQNTIALKELDKAIFNAPTRYNIPAANPSFGAGIQINVNANNSSAKDIGDSIALRLRDVFNVDSKSYSVRGYVPV